MVRIPDLAASNMRAHMQRLSGVTPDQLGVITGKFILSIERVETTHAVSGGADKRAAELIVRGLMGGTIGLLNPPPGGESG